MDIDEVLAPRRWNDFKEKKIKKGKLLSWEEKKIMASFCEVAKSKNLSSEALMDKVSNPLEDRAEGLWTQIAECLPHRSVQCVQNFCRRRFSPRNYKGAWTEEEENQLGELVEELGRKWQEIGEKLERTPLNVRDKWRSLSQKGKKSEWSLSELLRFVRIIEEVSDEKILNASDSAIKESLSSLKSPSSLKERKALISGLKSFAVENFDFEGLSVPWSSVSLKMGTRSHEECRNKWNLHFARRINSIAPNVKKQLLGKLIEKLDSENTKVNLGGLGGFTKEKAKQILTEIAKTHPKKNSETNKEYLQKVEQQLSAKKKKSYHKFQSREDQNALLKMFNEE